jgi:enoyl-CoA hydratase/carnithine racemase
MCDIRDDFKGRLGSYYMNRQMVITEDIGHVRVVTMNRPEKKNAFNNAMYRGMADALAAAQEDAAIRVVVITGAGGAFCAGQDISELSATDSEHAFPDFLRVLIDFDKPIVTAVNGLGIGIGLTMLLHTDINYIARGARFRLPFVTLGVVPEAASSYLLPVIIGHQKAAEILFTARWISAEESVGLGLTFAMIEPDDLLPTALAKATEIAAMPPASLRATKRLTKVWKKQAIAEARSREDQGFQERLGTPENLEAITAFFEKRPADFSKLGEG